MCCFTVGPRNDVSTFELTLCTRNIDRPYPPARWGNATPPVDSWLPVGWISSSQPAARIAPENNVGIRPHPETIRSYSLITNPPIINNSNNPRIKTGSTRVITAPQDVETLPPSANYRFDDLTRAHVASTHRDFPFGTTSTCRRNRVIVSRPRMKRPSMYLKLQQPEGGQTSPLSIPPSNEWKPEPHWLIYSWLVLMKPARGLNFPRRQRRGSDDFRGR